VSKKKAGTRCDEMNRKRQTEGETASKTPVGPWPRGTVAVVKKQEVLQEIRVETTYDPQVASRDRVGQKKDIRTLGGASYGKNEV